ncbi:MAG: hypothetical protein JW765_11360 [Deltaproteobacteria bacterium]|nr:hypothetical protein [Candidatus Zymogenaceae bacterium]
MINSIKAFILIFVLYLSLAPLAAYSISIEEFIKEYPDAIVSLNAIYYEHGNITPSGSSGLMDCDPFSFNKNNYIYLKDLYRSGIVPNDKLNKLIEKADESIDLANTSICDGNTIVDGKNYSRYFHEQENVLITNEEGYRIIGELFKVFDGMSRSQLQLLRPDFRLQLSINHTTHSDSINDGTSRANGIDPTPPIYGDVK